MTVTTKRGVTWQERTARLGERSIRYKVPVAAKPKQKRKASKTGPKAKPAISKKTRSKAPAPAKKRTAKKRSKPQAQLVLIG